MNLASLFLVGLTKALVGANARWLGPPKTGAQRIYFANHTSHIDTLAIWSALPPELREQTRPVAAKDYWDKGAVRRHIAVSGLNAVLIERAQEGRQGDPLEPLVQALEQGHSLIIFPEGTRGTEPLPGRFKSGLYRLAQGFPQVELVPVYLENLNRSMPKGTFLPIPLICTVSFGSALPRKPDEAKEAFLERARAAVVDLS